MTPPGSFSCLRPASQIARSHDAQASPKDFRRQTAAQPPQNTSLPACLGGTDVASFIYPSSTLGKKGSAKREALSPKAAMVILPQKSMGEFTAQ